ncbi:uncharacterized protein (TIGR02186 family) [Rhodobacteraceae bacterium MBR-64]
MRWALVILALALLPVPAQTVAQERVVAGLSRSNVAITANFDGSNILVFGAVRREAPIPEGAPLEVLITVQGPDRPVTVRRKAWRFGIWVNTDAIEVPRAPSFYAVATTAPIEQVISAEENRRFRVTVPEAIGPVLPDGSDPGGAAAEPSGGADDDETQEFLAALLRIQTRAGRYRLAEAGVDFEEATLFRSEFSLPANLTEGIYRTRIFLTRDGQVVDVLVKDISVNKVGLERWLFNLAHRQPLAYGLLSLALAVFAGWGASTLVRYWRQ